MATTIVSCVCGSCCCVSQQQQQVASASGSPALSSCGRSVGGVTAGRALPSSVAAAEAAASDRSTAPRRPLVVDWQLQDYSQGGMLICGYVYECTGFKVLPPAILSGGVLLTTDGEEYDLLHPCYDLRTGTIATSPGCATDAEAPPMLRSSRRGRRNVPASSRHLRSSSDNEKMAATDDGRRAAHSCSRCTHVDQAGPCSLAPATTAGCAATAAAVAIAASGGVTAVCSSGVDTGCRMDDKKRIARLCTTVTCPAQPCLSSTPSTVHCLQRFSPVAGPSATTVAASERSLPLLRPPTPFGDASPTDLHVVVEAGSRRDVCGLTAPCSQRHLSDLTTAIRPAPPLPTVGTSDCRASAQHCPAGNRLRTRRAEIAKATAASSVATMPVTENMQTARLCDCQPLSCKGRAAHYDRDPVTVTSVASDQSLNRPAVVANCNGCTAALSLLANWGINVVASRQITEPIQGETLAESSLQSNVSVSSVFLPHVASGLSPCSPCKELPRTSAPLSSVTAQAAAVRTTVYPCRSPAASTSTTAALRTTAALHRTEWSSSSGVTATSAFTEAANSGRILRSSDRHTDASASTSGRTLRSAAGRFDLSCTSTSTSVSELPSFDPNFNWSSSRDGVASTASSSASTASSSARRRKRDGRESAGKEHPHDSGKRPRLTVTEAAPEPSTSGHHSRKCHRGSSRRVQVSSRIATSQSDAVLSVTTRTTGSRRTDQALVSSHAHSHRVRGHRKVDRCEQDARSSTDCDDVARSVSSWRSRQHDGKHDRRRAACSRSRSPSPLSQDGGADRHRSATRGSSGRAGHRQGTALGSYEAATHVKGRCRASGDRRRCRDVMSVADSDAVRGRLRSDGAAAESFAPSSTDSGICLPAGGHSRQTSSGRSVARSDSHPRSSKRALEAPHATAPSASSSGKTREQPLRAAAAKRASKKEGYFNDPLRGRRPAGRTR